jgi:hypothetical protein
MRAIIMVNRAVAGELWISNRRLRQMPSAHQFSVTLRHHRRQYCSARNVTFILSLKSVNLRQDGEKEVAIRKIVNRAKNYMPTIKADLDLLEKLLKVYTK